MGRDSQTISGFLGPALAAWPSYLVFSFGKRISITEQRLGDAGSAQHVKKVFCLLRQKQQMSKLKSSHLGAKAVQSGMRRKTGDLLGTLSCFFETLLTDRSSKSRGKKVSSLLAS